ncbi:OmpA family protein [Duganella sp. LX20W]|uniref:OmpA family protein n=1 Tax=Rugamonas brunnea TaxID=2758569 RepID=A0A7W2IAD5_9BURK|nr:OmpA family protein [Rugamonas brunnea]MBA5636043.1 OmpA family protein [Rugamonas brunnea]
MKKIIMHKSHAIPAAFALSVLMAACSSTPTTTSLLDQARGDYLAAQGNPAVARDAPAELQQATEALDRANAAAAHRDSLNTIDSLAYAAKQRIAAAQEVARQKAAERQVADASRQRDQVLVQERTQEADQQRMKAQQAQAQAQSANAQAQAANAQASALQQELADLKAKQTDRGLVITFGDVLFNVDQAQLSAQGMRTAARLADVLRQQPASSVLVEGFTDSTGSAAHNLELSQRRAEAVRNALAGMGIAPDRIATRGYGEAYPVASNDNAGNRQLNRRVEIVLSQNGAPIANRH